MDTLPIEKAREIIAATLKKGHEMGLKPLTVAVLDAAGSVKALEREDGTANMRPDIAIGKAFGAISLGLGSRALFERAKQEPFFIQAMNSLAHGSLVPVPGGVLIKDADGVIVGACGVTGDTSGNDEEAAIHGIESAGYTADGG